MTDAIQIENLSVQISGKNILRDICVSLEAGKLIGLIGPNGSGKTTLLNCMSGLIRDYSGAIHLMGNELSNLNQRSVAKQLAYLHQHMPAQLKLSVRQVVELGLIPALQPWATISLNQHSAIDNAIEKVALQALEHRSFESLSGGEKQRVLIAKTIVQQPEMLLMDEPTNHLDIKHQVAILTLVKSLKLTTITCIHDVNLALAVCDEIVCLNNGKMAFHKNVVDINSCDFSDVYDVDCMIDRDPFDAHPRLSVRWS